MQDDEDKRGPGLKFPPPLLAPAVIGPGWVFDLAIPLPIRVAEAPWLTGLAIVGIALLLAVISLLQFVDAKTHVEPWKPATTIISKGLFRYSRNPIYLAFCIATIGIGLVLNSWWIVGSVLPLIVLLQRLVISREEAYLEHKFGESYLDYKRRVRRWL